MARVSQSEVDLAAGKVLTQVQQSGGKLTLKMVMAQIKADTGRAGDPGLVGDLLNHWRASHGTSQTAEPIRIDVPETVKSAFAASLAEMWHQAEERANARLKSEREALEAERGRMQERVNEVNEVAQGYQDELTEAGEKNQHLTEEVIALSAKNETLIADKANLTDSLHQAQATLEERTKQAAAHDVERKAMTERISVLTEQHGRLQATSDQLREQANKVKPLETERNELTSAVARLEAKLDGANVRAGDAKKRADEKDAQMDKVREKLEQTSNAFQSANSRVEQAERELVDVKKRLTTAEKAVIDAAKLEQTERALEDMKMRLAMAEKAAIDADKAAVELRGKLAAQQAANQPQAVVANAN